MSADCLRIAIVSPYSWTVPSGVNNHVKSLSDQLERQGHEVCLIAPAGTLIRPASGLPDNFIVAGRSFPVEANGSLAHSNATPWMLQRMGRILEKGRFDLVHVHEPTIPAVGCSATMAAKVPVVGTFHAAGASEYYERWRPLARRILASITVRTAVSEAARECVAEQFPADYRVIPNGIDLGIYAPARQGTKVPGKILFIGRPEPRKGLGVLVDAFGALHERLPHASLVLVGPGPLELQTALDGASPAAVEAAPAIRPLGRISQEVKVEEMGSAELLCAPSLGGESFGIVLTEAFAAGLPVVASDIPGYRRVLGGGTAGSLVPPGDAQALEEALFLLLGDGAARTRLCEEGLARVERYSWERVIDSVMEAYEDALFLGPRIVPGPRVPVIELVRHLNQRRAAVRARARRKAPSSELGPEG